MKQKAVIKFSMVSPRSSSKALKAAVSISGVESVELKGDDKSQIEVIGDGMDTVVLTTLMRKKVGYAQLVSVGPAGDGGKKKEEKPKIPEEKVQPIQYILPYQDYEAAVPHYDHYVVTADRQPECCSIM